MSIPVLTSNNVKIYTVTGQSHHKLPDWIVRKHSKKLKKDAEFSRRVQLLQDFDFPEASLRISLTPDHQHIIASGVYKPQFKVFDLSEASLKFERHTSSETIAMQILSDDWKKLALLQSNRYIEFHNSSGIYHSTRIPKMGRDMIYDWNTCDLLISSSSNEVYRLNLDRGQFMAPLESLSSAINCVKVSPLHGLYGLAGSNGTVEFWDRRDRNRLGVISFESSNALQRLEAIDDNGAALEITALNFLPDGIHWAAGTSDGRVLLFDLRSHKPLDIRDHYNGHPIKKIEYHSSKNASTLVSSDKKSIKFWNGSGPLKLFTSIETENDVNDFVVQPESGLVLVAGEGSPISSYFIPNLGPAPRWCNFLENLTEEMEEKANSTAAVYDNFKFVTRVELSKLGLDHLVGTNLLRAYMHGYFIDLRLYEKAKTIANPFAYEEYLAKKKQEKLEKERQSRIRAADPIRSVKVNKKLAVKLAAAKLEPSTLEPEDQVATTSRAAKQKKKAKDTAEALLKDDRFADLFKDPDFEIDETSLEFKQIYPSNK